jgi:hypothetical protein
MLVSVRFGGWQLRLKEKKIHGGCPNPTLLVETTHIQKPAFLYWTTACVLPICMPCVCVCEWILNKRSFIVGRSFVKLRRRKWQAVSGKSSRYRRTKQWASLPCWLKTAWITWWVSNWQNE